MPLEWSDLSQTFKYFPPANPLATVRSRFKQDITPRDTIGIEFVGCLQNRTGKLSMLPEGLQSQVESVLYCNPTSRKGKDGLPLQFDEEEQIEFAGKRYRIVFADAPAGDDGKPDHFKLYLKAVGKGGDAK